MLPSHGASVVTSNNTPFLRLEISDEFCGRIFLISRNCWWGVVATFLASLSYMCLAAVIYTGEYSNEYFYEFKRANVNLHNAAKI